MDKQHNQEKIVSLEDRIPKLKNQRKQKTNRRLIMFISVFFLLILLVVYFQSPLSKVSSIEVVGNQLVSEKEIIERSEITNHSGIWNVNEKEVETLIKENEQIKSVKLTKEFPNHVIIHIEENRRVAYIEKSNRYSSILENGHVFDQPEEVQPYDAPILIDWKDGDMISEMVSELVKLPTSIINSISEIHHTPTENDPWHINLYMNDGFQVSATIRGFSEKMKAYPAIVKQLDPETKGIIYMEVGTYFKAFENESEDEIQLSEEQQHQSQDDESENEE